MRHMVAETGYALTECGQVAVLRGGVVIDLSLVDCPSCLAALINRGVCPECGAAPKRGSLIAAEEKLAWGFHATSSTFYLGCEVCSATLVSGVGPQMVLDVLNEHRWRP